LDLQEVGGGEAWIDLSQDREKGQDLVNAVTNLRVPLTVWRLTTHIWVVPHR